MKKNIKRAVIFWGLFAVFVLGIVWFLGKNRYYPVITNSESLDAKVHHYQLREFKKIHVLAVGSSMTLNQIDSSEMKFLEPDKIYYNFGAWGLQMEQVLFLVKALARRHHPESVIVSSSTPDFSEKERNIKIPWEFSLYPDFPAYFYFKSNIASIVKRKKTMESYEGDLQGYRLLNFDDSGGVLLDIPVEKIDLSRWDEKKVFPTLWTEFQYQNLERLAALLRKRKIKFLFVQAPIRKETAFVLGLQLENHIARCRMIVLADGGYYFNFHDPEIYTDDLFVDAYHLSSRGSKIYTQQIAAEFKKI